MLSDRSSHAPKTERCIGCPFLVSFPGPDFTAAIIFYIIATWVWENVRAPEAVLRDVMFGDNIDYYYRKKKCFSLSYPEIERTSMHFKSNIFSNRREKCYKLSKKK